MPRSCRRRCFAYLLPGGARRIARCRLVTPVSRRFAESAALARVSPKAAANRSWLSRTCCRPRELTASAGTAPRPVLLHLATLRYVQSAHKQLDKKRKKSKSLQNPPTPPVSSRIRGINVEIVARRCSSTSEMKYLLLKVEKRCQTTIEKILKSIVDERRSSGPLVERIWPRPAGAAGRTTTLALRGCPRTTTLAYDRALISKGCRTRGLRALL